MFGLLRPAHHATTRRLPASYMSEYCDLCGVLALKYGLKARPLLVHDITTLGWLLGPAADSPTLFPRSNCVKGGTRSVRAPDRRPARRTRLAAALSCYAVAVKVGDDLQDEPSWRSRALQSFYARTFAAARRDLQQLAFPVGRLDAALADQAEIERWGTGELDVAAGPTGRAYAVVASHLSSASVSPGTEPATAVETVATIGDALGRCVYVIDAYRDVEGDRGVRYNPLCCAIAATDVQLAVRRDEARAYIAAQLRRAISALGGASSARQNRWQAVEHRLRGLVGLQAPTVTLNATCCIPCGDGAVAVDDKECWPMLCGGLCCFVCLCDKLCG